MNYTIREMKQEEYTILADFLYEAIYVPDGMQPPLKSIILSSELQVYLENFGERKDDKGFVAIINDKIVGAVWVRIMDDYGHIDDNTPSFAISLYKEYRRLGIGTALMSAMLSLLKENGYKRASLAVWKENYAVRMYQKAGFQIVSEKDGEYIMVNYLQE